jgi:hypothetical protein
MRRDSLQTVIDRGRNSTKAIRFGSGANTQSVTIDSNDIRSIVSSTYYSIFGASGLTSIQGTTQRSFGAVGYVRLNNSTGIYNTLDFANPTVSNKTITIQDKSGTLALLSDITDSIRRDSISTVLDRGKNTPIPMRFGSGANVSSLTIDSNGIVHRSSGAIDFNLTQNALWLYNGGGSFYNNITTTTPSATRTTSFQDKSGTVALLSDFTDTIANRLATKSDTLWQANSLRLVTESDMNTIGATRVNLGGNTVGGRMIVGTIDSQDYVNRYFNRGDTIQVSNGLHTYEAKNSEIIARYFNYNQTTGVRNTKGILLINSLTTEGNNVPMIGFGTSYTTSTPRITENGIFGYPVLNIYSSSTAGTIIKPAFSASNTGDAITLSLGSYTITNNTPTTGNMNMFKIGTGSASTGQWSPSSGSSNLRLIQGAVRVTATSTYSGTIKFVTDDSMSLALANGYYIGYEANQNVGWGFRQNRTGAKNAFAGRTTIGDTVDNGTDQLQVYNGSINIATAGGKIKIATGSNASVNGSTFSGGTVTVSNTAVTASSRIFIQYTSCSNCGTTYISAKVAGTSFTVTSSNGSDASTFDYWIIN